MIYGNATGGFGYPKTLELSDESGNTAIGVITGSKVVFTANPKTDIREGKVAATDAGVVIGGKDIPGYHTTTGVRFIPANSEFKITISDGDYYDYTELQALTMPYNSSVAASLAVDRAVIKDKVYNAGSTSVIATVTKNSVDKAISFGIVNGDTPAVIRFFTYKEEL